MSRFPLNGWWRLWIVVSLLWASGVLLKNLDTYPTPAYYERQAHQAIFALPGGADSAARATFMELAATQSRPEQISVYRNYWWLEHGMVALIGPFLLGIAFLLVAWIRGGFSGRRRGVRVVEAEIEDP
jgi:hypothetical protein